MNPPAPPVVPGAVPPPPPPVPMAPPVAEPPPEVPLMRALAPSRPPVTPSAPDREASFSGLQTAGLPMQSRAYSHGLSGAARKDAAEEDSRAPLPVGTVVGNYTVTGCLGQGGYGITYRARHSTRGTVVVIKEHMPIGMATRRPGSAELSFPTTRAEEHFQATMAEFLEEITVLRALEYPGIVPIIDSFEANDTAYYVMPFISGSTLQQPGKISLDPRELRRQAQRLKRMLHSLLSTADYLEHHHIVHRDIKPDNILVSTEGLPILLDFGSARQLQPGKVFTNVFTPDFCAPEQATARSDAEMSRALGPWTDLYSLGATFYYLIAHIMPPSAEMRKMSTPDPYKPLAKRSDLAEAYGEEFLKAIDRAMELNPHDRWESAAAWRASLEEDTVVIPPRIMRHIRIVGCIAAVVAVIVGCLGIFALQEHRQVKAAYSNGLNFTESILNDFSTELIDIPGSIALQRRLNASLQKYLASMRDLPSGQDGRMDRALAAAWFNIGCTHMSLGNLNEAREALEHAEQLESMINHRNPDDQRFCYELARTYLAQAELANRSGRYADSAAHAQAAVDLLQKLYAQYPNNPDYGCSLGGALAFETLYLRRQGNHEARKKVLDELVPLFRRQVARFPRHEGSQSGLGQALHYRGRYAKDTEDYPTAEKYLTEAHKVFKRLMENQPYRLSFKKSMAEVLYTMGDMYYYRSMQEPDLREVSFRKAVVAFNEHIALVNELRRLDSSNMDYLLMECKALDTLADIQLQLGEINDSEATSRAILEKVEFLLSKEPTNAAYVAAKAHALSNLAQAHRRSPRHRAKAPLELAESRELLAAHMHDSATPPEVILLAQLDVLAHSAAVALETGEREQALAWLAEADTQLQDLIRDNSTPSPRHKACRAFIRRLQEQAGSLPTAPPAPAPN